MKQKIEWIIIIIVWLALLIVAIFFLSEWWDWDKIIDYLWNEPWENLSNSWQLNNNENPILEQWPYSFSLAVIGIGLFSLNYFKHLDSVLMMVVGVIMTIPIILGLVLLIINIVELISGSIINVLRILLLIVIVTTFFTLPINCIVSLFSQSGNSFKDDLRKAKHGDKEAQCRVAKVYYDEEKNYEEAVKWYHKAAEQGNADAQYTLGLCYAKGQVVEQDYPKAVKWYRKAAEQGNAAAQNNLGWCYYYGQGEEQNYAEAVKWFNKAAEQGNVRAQNNNENEYFLDIHYDIDHGFDDYDYSQETWDAFIKGLYEDRSDDYDSRI